MLLMQRLYYIYFWQGRSAEMLELTQLAAPGPRRRRLHAGLPRLRARGEPALRRGAAPWRSGPSRSTRGTPGPSTRSPTSSTSAGENDRGVDALPPRIHPCDHLGYFRNHLLWHLALMHLAEGRYDRVRKLFQSVFGDMDDHRRVRPPGLGGARLAARPLRPAGSRGAGSTWARPRAGGSRCRSCSSTISTSAWRSAPPETGRRGAAARAAAPAGEEDPQRDAARRWWCRSWKGLHAFARGEYAESVARIEPLTERIVEVGRQPRPARGLPRHAPRGRAARGRSPSAPTALLERRVAKRPNPGRHWLEARALMDWTTIGDETVDLLRALPPDRHDQPARQRDGGRALPRRGARRRRHRERDGRVGARAAATWWRASRATDRSAASCSTTTSTWSTRTSATGPWIPSAASSGTATSTAAGRST